MATVSLHVIAKDEIEQIRRINNEYKQYFDEITVAVDSQESLDFLIKEYPHIRFYKYEWIDDFSDKRNFLASKCTTDYYFRIDTDDKIINPEKIKTLADKAKSHNIDVVLCWYEYAKDHYGNVHAAHWRESLVRTVSRAIWKKKIHENVVPSDNVPLNTVIEKGIVIEHLLDLKEVENKKKRNLKFLLAEYEQDKENADPRTLAYLGRMLYPMGDLEGAKYFLELHTQKSGWDADKMKSWCMLADIMSDLGNNKQAIGACFEALNECENFPDPYLKLSEIYNKMSQWKKSIRWGNLGLHMESPLSTTLYDPSSYTWRPAIVMAHSYMMDNDITNAKKFFDMAEKLVPDIDWVKANKPHYEEAVEQKDFIERFIWIARLLKQKSPQLLPKIFEIIPDHLKGHEILVGMKHQVLPPVIWGQDTVEIFCGQAWEDWAAPSVINGIGGSEEAVIYLSRELAKLGWKVTVYCSCGDMAGEYEGVTYKQYFEFNFNDHHNIVISWRNNIFRKGMTCKKRYIWLHDVMPRGTYNDDNIEYFDKAIVLSKYHKDVIGLPPNKTYVSRNGVNLDDFRGSKEVRNPHRMIYTSSYDRGIEYLLKRWSEVRTAVPDAELHLFYGWDTYDKMMEVGRRPREYRDYMTKLMQQEGVFEHGRVGHKKLIRELYKSGLYVYPSDFDEISCISAMKAQECGCVPVVFDYAALKETVKSGIKIEGKATDDGAMDKYIGELIDVLKDVDSQEMFRADLPSKVFGWDGVARDWNDNLLTLKRRQYRDYEDYKSHYVTHGKFQTSNFSPDGQFLIYPRYQMVLEYIKKNGYNTFIDAGCSDGVLCFAAEQEGADTVGIDADKKTIEFATKYADEKNLSCEFKNCLLEEYDTDEKFDCASAFEIIEHVIDPKKFIEKLDSLVKDGGIIFLSTPEKDGFYGEKNFNEQHINHFTKDSLEELIGKERIVEWRNDKDTLLVAYKK